ncbi:MAG: response regulator transcription factor [Cyanobacteria bacterium J06621_12]
MIRILIVDDQNLVQQGIKSLLDQDPEIKVIGTVKDGRTAITQVNKLRPDIVLLDIEMPGMDGITTTKYITHLSPQTKVIILSSHEDKKYLTRALMAGAKSYILKDSLMTDLKQSIIAVNKGYTQIESRLLAKIFDPSNFKQAKGQKESSPIKQLPRKSQSEIKNKVRDHGFTRENNYSLSASTQDQQPLMFPDQITSDNLPNATVANQVEQLETTIPEVDKVTYLQSIPAVPKINLPNAEYVSDFPSETNAAIEPVSLINQAPPSKVASHESAQHLTGSSSSNSLMLVTKPNQVKHLANQSSIAKYKVAIANFWVAKKIQYRPLIKRCQSQFAQYKAEMQPRLQLWYEKGWLANAALVLLGLVTFIIIHQMFS